jgi:hypothetical protein
MTETLPNDDDRTTLSWRSVVRPISRTEEVVPVTFTSCARERDTGQAVTITTAVDIAAMFFTGVPTMASLL